MTYKNRSELKYLVHWHQYIKIKEELKPYLLRDRNTKKEDKYEVRSLYYDSPNRQMFFEKIEGYDDRYKLRLRSYIQKRKVRNSFIEIKRRFNRTIKKHRIMMSIEDAKSFLGSPGPLKLQDYPKKDQQVLKEMLFLKHYYNLKPMVTTSYYREPYVIKYASNVRITFDTFIKFINEFKPSRGIREGFIVDPQWVIMEIKHCGFIPIWLIELVQRHNLQAITFSKYCEGIKKVRWE